MRRACSKKSRTAPAGRSNAFCDWNARSSGSHDFPVTGWRAGPGSSPPTQSETMMEQAHRSTLSNLTYKKYICRNTFNNKITEKDNASEQSSDNESNGYRLRVTMMSESLASASSCSGAMRRGSRCSPATRRSCASGPSPPSSPGS